jgi:hypothetical protein
MTDVLVNGIRLHYQVFGTGTPLVLAHGYGATLEMWAGQIGVLSERCQAVVYDTRGHGRTEAPREWSSYTLDDYVEDQRQLMGVVETPLFRAAPDNQHGYLVDEMLSVLGDVESEGYYRGLAATVPKEIIFEGLSLAKRAVHEGKIRKSRGALFVAIVKRACADRGVVVGESPVGVR